MKKLMALVTLMVALASCSGDDAPDVALDQEDATPSSTTTTEPEAAPPDGTVAYFEAFLNYDPERMQEMVNHSKPGSPARAYAEHQINIATYVPDLPTDETIEVADDTITITSRDQNGQPDPTTYDDFVADSDGLLVRFSVEGAPIVGRLPTRPAQVTGSGITLELRSAYQTSQTNLLTVFFDITNNASTPFDDASNQASYVDADGRQFQPEQGNPSITVQPGATALFAVVFPRATISGRMVYTGFLDNFFTEVHLELPVR